MIRKITPRNTLSKVVPIRLWSYIILLYNHIIDEFDQIREASPSDGIILNELLITEGWLSKHVRVENWEAKQCNEGNANTPSVGNFAMHIAPVCCSVPARYCVPEPDDQNQKKENQNTVAQRWV